MSEQHPAHSAERKAFRDRQSLRCVTVTEEGSHISKIPDGVYGFTASPASEEMPIFVAPTFQAFEVHKLQGGDVALVGYVRVNEKEALQKASGELAVNLYPEPLGEASHLVAIPLSRIGQRKQPSRDSGNWMRVQLVW